jgi:hypothetical protein
MQSNAKARTWYTLEGELWSGCVHMTNIDRATARRYIRQYGIKAVSRRGISAAEFPLSLRTCSRIAPGYTYREVRIGLTRESRRWDNR